jgi:hypothetical protein
MNDANSSEQPEGSQELNPDSKPAQKRGAQPDLPWWIVATILVLAVALIAAYGLFCSIGTLFVVELMVGVAALSVGALLGFLFGIPRSQMQSHGRGTTDRTTDSDGGTPQDARGPAYTPSTNLEQVSDWLTKILVGVGLVEFNRLREALTAAGDLVATSFKPPVPAASVVSQLTMIVFSILGFLSSFLWTRVYYGAIQFLGDVRVDVDTDLMLEELKKGAIKSEAEIQKALKLAEYVAGGKLTQARSTIEPEAERVAAIGPPPEGQGPQREVFEKIEKFQRAPADFNSNPTGDLFGDELSSINGRRLVGRIEVQLEGALVLAVRVEAMAGSSPLTGEAIFLLHPTLPDPLRRVQCKDNAAEVKFYAEGWFHVVAIVDNLQTVLALDLRQVPNIPNWYKEV